MHLFPTRACHRKSLRLRKWPDRQPVPRWYADPPHATVGKDESLLILFLRPHGADTVLLFA